jgi:hypothetical protein
LKDFGENCGIDPAHSLMKTDVKKLSEVSLSERIEFFVKLIILLF